jgi:hypothetical protein
MKLTLPGTAHMTQAMPWKLLEKRKMLTKQPVILAHGMG